MRRICGGSHLLAAVKFSGLQPSDVGYRPSDICCYHVWHCLQWLLAKYHGHRTKICRNYIWSLQYGGSNIRILGTMGGSNVDTKW